MKYDRGNLVFTDLKGVYTVSYQGQGVSNNKFYSAQDWRIRHGIKTKYGKIFSYLLMAEKLPWMDEYMMLIFYNSRHDADNVSAMGKLMLDCLKEEREAGQIVKKGWVYDDSKEYLKGFAVFPDNSLKSNTFEFVILHIK